MEWLTQVMTSPFPVAMVLGAGCAALWRAWQAERDEREKERSALMAAMAKVQDSRIEDLKSIAKLGN